MRFLTTILSIFLFSIVGNAQSSAVVPIIEMKIKGLLGGAQNGKWLTAKQVAPKFKNNTELFLVGWKGIEEGGVTTGSKGETEDVCQDFYRMKLDLEMDSGVALGSNANWNPAPRLPHTIDSNNAEYRKIVAEVLRTKRLAKTTVKIKQAYRVDLEGDGMEEVLLTATYYRNGLASNAKAGDYSFVLVRKIIGGRAQNMILAGDFVVKNINFGAPSEYEISSIADLNGDRRMEIVIYGEYYEGHWVEAHELRGNKPAKVLSTGRGV